MLTTNWENLDLQAAGSAGKFSNIIKTLGKIQKSAEPQVQSEEIKLDDKKTAKKPKQKQVSQKVPEPVIEPVEEAEDDLEGALVLKSSPWIFRVAGLEQDAPVTAARLPTFTTNMPKSGTLTIETLSGPGHALNRYFRDWVEKPLVRQVQLVILDPTGVPIETWSGDAVPIAMGFSEHNVFEEDPWVTQVAFSLSNIRIEETKL